MNPEAVKQILDTIQQHNDLADSNHPGDGRAAPMVYQEDDGLQIL